MGFSLVGNSGSSTSNVYETSYSASLNPQQDLEGSGAGAMAINLSPLLQGSSIGTYNPEVLSAYAPVNIVSTGNVQGDSALNALQDLASGQTSASEAPGTASPSTSSLSSLFSGNTIYYVLGALVLLFVAFHHK